MGHLYSYMKQHKTEMMKKIPKTKLINWDKINSDVVYDSIPMALRQALAVYV